MKLWWRFSRGGCVQNSDWQTVTVRVKVSLLVISSAVVVVDDDDDDDSDDDDCDDDAPSW